MFYSILFYSSLFYCPGWNYASAWNQVSETQLRRWHGIWAHWTKTR